MNFKLLNVTIKDSISKTLRMHDKNSWSFIKACSISIISLLHIYRLYLTQSSEIWAIT